MTLELFTATGALVGGLVAFALSEQVLAGLFTVLLVYTAFTMARRRDAPVAAVATDDETPARFGALTADPPGSADAPSATTERPRRSRRDRPRRRTRRRMPSATWVAGSSAACSPGSCRRCSGSAAGSSRCR